jgi:ankyrin repeat protein
MTSSVEEYNELLRWILQIENSRTPLYTACKTTNMRYIEILLDHGADIHELGMADGNDGDSDLEDYDGECSPFLIACQHGDVKMVELLLKYDTNEDNNRYDTSEDNDRYGTSLECVCKYGHTEIAHILLEYKKGILKKNSHLLYIACKYENIKIIHLLIEYGTYISHNSTNNPLEYICEIGNLEIAQILIKNGAYTKDNGSLYNACKGRLTKDNTEIVRLLIDTNVEPRSRVLENALLVACKTRNIEVIKMLLEHYSQIYTIDMLKSVIFHCKNRNVPLLLLDHTIDVKTHCYDTEIIENICAYGTINDIKYMIDTSSNFDLIKATTTKSRWIKVLQLIEYDIETIDIAQEYLSIPKVLVDIIGTYITNITSSLL